jgi:hypothetical protein
MTDVANGRGDRYTPSSGGQRDAMPERMTIVIRGREGLTIEDAMRQVLDTFELLDRSNPLPNQTVEWRLVSASTNSPLTVVAEAASVRPGVDAASVARVQKKTFAACIAELRSGRLPDIWSSIDTRNTAKRLVARVANGIAATDILFDGTEDSIQLTAEDTRILTPTLNSALHIGHPAVQIGSVEGFLDEVTTYYNKPAIKVLERRSRSSITCVVPDEFAAEIGLTATLDDVWRNRRVVVRGRIYYDGAGNIERVIANTVELLSDENIDIARLSDPEFTGGLSAEEYLTRFRDGELG